MSSAGWLIFLLAVLFGSYVQSVAGFAMGMIVMAVGGAAGVGSLPVLTATVSLISGVNIALSIRGHVAEVRRPLFLAMAVGQIPAIVCGVCLLALLDRDARTLLELLLGVFITVGSISMTLRPAPQAHLSSPWACLAAGFGGGLIGGLFSASGPVIGWFVYRQPLRVAVIRATLLSTFALATVMRTLVVGLDGGITSAVLRLTVAALPIVVLGAWLGRVAPPSVSEAGLKRAVFLM